ncbi:MAG: single-stranded DNA-binding protein [Clostridia bacterium]
MNNYEFNNYVELVGTITKESIFSHSVGEENFYETEIAVARLSGERDFIPLLVAEKDLNLVQEGARAYIHGQYRSYNKFENNKSRLLLTVFCKNIIDGNSFYEEKDLSRDFNKIVLSGFICKPPIYRKTPLNREITDVLIAVNRNYSKSDYVPIIAWGKDALDLSTRNVGDPLTFEGRIQSREYTKRYENGEQEIRTAYEVSITRLSNENCDANAINFMSVK